MDFGDAIRAMKQGYCVQRSGWDGSHIYIEDHFHCLVGRGGGRSYLVYNL